MIEELAVSPDNIGKLYYRLQSEAEAGGYHLNPNVDFTKELVRGLLINHERYGYRACPCRLASGQKEEDIDIICPCYYRDPDLSDYGTCYCGLYASMEAISYGSIPERRPPIKERRKVMTKPTESSISSLPLPVWRCKVCGYLCAREAPPDVCPICKAEKDRFERFI